MSEVPWYQELFGEDYLRVWAPMMPPERTERELEGLIQLLGMPEGSSILDLCCGHGRHAIPLAQRGYQVTGQDLSKVFLERAKKEAEARGVEVRYQYCVLTCSLTELVKILAAAGFALEACCGGLDGSSLTMDNHRLVVVGRK
jgi:SAM-dependent methyltransferase